MAYQINMERNIVIVELAFLVLRNVIDCIFMTHQEKDLRNLIKMFEFTSSQ